MKNEWYQGKSEFVKECDYEIDDSWQDFFEKEEVEILLGLIEDYLEREEKNYPKKDKDDVYCYYPYKENVLRFASPENPSVMLSLRIPLIYYSVLMNKINETKSGRTAAILFGV